MVFRSFNLALAAFFGIGSSSGAEVCGCEAKAICSIVRDPHVTDFSGKTTIIPIPIGDTVLYQVGTFKVIATIGERGLVSKVNVHDSFSTDECGSTKMHKWSRDLGGQGAIEITSTCAQTKDKVWFLNTVITKTDKSSDPAQTFPIIEDKLKSSGLCVTGHTPSNFTDTMLVGQPTMTCSCSRICTMVGDPHLKSFFGDTKGNYDAGDVVLFTGQQTSVRAHVPVSSPKDWMKSVDFEGQTYDSATACKGKKAGFRLPKMPKQLSGNSLLELQLVCESNQKSHGWFWNIELTKTNTVGGSNAAKTWEAAEHSFGNKGECYFQKALVVV